MRLRGLVFLILVHCGSGLMGQGGGVVSDWKGVSFQEALRKHKIGLTRPELIAALRNGDAEVRSLAAAQLVGDQVTEAIPEIAKTLRAETDGLARVNIAKSLALLGSREGTNTLKSICNDGHAKGHHRLLAAGDLMDQGDESCAPSVLELAQ